MASVSAVAVGVVAAHKFGIASPQRLPIGIGSKPQNSQKFSINIAEFPPISALLRSAAEAGADRIQWIGEILPFRRRRAIGGKGPRLPVPAAKGRLSRIDLVRAHSFEIIIAVIEGADVVEAEPAPFARPIKIGAAPLFSGRAEFTRRIATRMRARLLMSFNSSVKSGLSLPRARQPTAFPTQTDYIGKMSKPLSGSVAAEIEIRLTQALSPTQLIVTNDSAKHSGHAGDDGSGESHFSVEIVADQFASMNRVQRQRAVNDALRDLLRERIHALAIRAKAPGE